MELPQLGHNCAAVDCKQLDFLPFKCHLCGLDYCLEHRLPTLHQCAKWEQTNKVDHLCSIERYPKTSPKRCDVALQQTLIECLQCHSKVFVPLFISTSEQALNDHSASGCQLYVFETSARTPTKPCCAEGCKNVEKIVGGVRCDGCGDEFCLGHRHPLSHACSSLTAHEVAKEQRRQAALGILEDNFKRPVKAAAGTATAAVAKKPAKKGSKLVEMMKMKAKAQGDSGVPMQSRLYLQVSFPNGSGREPFPFFFDKTWTVGRALDRIAMVGKVANINNEVTQDDKRRLFLCKLPTREILANGGRLEDVLESADEVLLETKAGLIGLVDKSETNVGE